MKLTDYLLFWHKLKSKEVEDRVNREQASQTTNQTSTGYRVLAQVGFPLTSTLGGTQGTTSLSQLAVGEGSNTLVLDISMQEFCSLLSNRKSFVCYLQTNLASTKAS